MRGLIPVFAGVLLLSSLSVLAKPLPADDHGSVVIVFKDGHRQTVSTDAISRIDLKTPEEIVYKDGRREKLTAGVDHIEFTSTDAIVPGKAHFIGKWKVGDGAGNSFFITLDADGDARKTLGSAHGTWTVVNGEARIQWDDGWHDAIRKVGARHEKRAYEPGKSFDDVPSNVAPARNTEAKPI
jgi:hypothetical protein